MYFFVPDITSDLSDPKMAAMRRFIDMHYAVFDHYDHVDEISREEDIGDHSFIVGLDADCGYVLRLEFRMRGDIPETGYTLVEPGNGMRSPIFRCYRRGNAGHWLGCCYNMANASGEMRRLCGSLRMATDGRRYEFSDLASNIAFGKVCQMMLYGFMND